MKITFNLSFILKGLFVEILKKMIESHPVMTSFDTKELEECRKVCEKTLSDMTAGVR